MTCSQAKLAVFHWQVKRSFLCPCRRKKAVENGFSDSEDT